MPDAVSNNDALIQHISDLPAYSPPAHLGTVNRRLVGREFGAGFEMVGSSRVDLQACKLEYSIVSPK